MNDKTSAEIEQEKKHDLLNNKTLETILKSDLTPPEKVELIRNELEQDLFNVKKELINLIRWVLPTLLLILQTMILKV